MPVRRMAEPRSLVCMGGRAWRLRRTVSGMTETWMLAAHSRRRTGMNNNGRRARLDNNRRRRSCRYANSYVHMHCGFGFTCSNNYKQHTGHTQ